MTKIYVAGNFKGGVGKSTSVKMLGFVSAQYKNRKTLLVDFDMQGNLSDIMARTHDLYNDEPLEYNKDLTLGSVLMEDIPAEKAVYNVIPNLDILPANLSLKDYVSFIERKFESRKDQLEYAKSKLYDLFSKYDAVYLDVPPSISIYSETAIYLAQYVIIILQTQTQSMENTVKYLNYIAYFNEEVQKDVKILGVIPFMLDSGDTLDKKMYEQAKSMFEQFLLKNVVFKNARLKRYDATGITTELTSKGKVSQWDRKNHKLFVDILDELDENMKKFYGN